MGESEECMKGIQTFEETGNADKAIAVIEAKEKPKTAKSTSSYNIKTRSGNTYFSLDSKSWQGGITTIATPTDRGITLAEKIQAKKIIQKLSTAPFYQNPLCKQTSDNKRSNR